MNNPRQNNYAVKSIANFLHHLARSVMVFVKFCQQCISIKHRRSDINKYEPRLVPLIGIITSTSLLVVGYAIYFGVLNSLMLKRIDFGLICLILGSLCIWRINKVYTVWAKPGRKPLEHLPSKPRGSIDDLFHTQLPFTLRIIRLLEGCYLTYWLERRIHTAKCRKSFLKALSFFISNSIASIVIIAVLGNLILQWETFEDFLYGRWIDRSSPIVYRRLWICLWSYIALLPAIYGGTITFGVFMHISWVKGNGRILWRLIESVGSVVLIYSLLYGFLVYKSPGHISGIREISSQGSLDYGFEKYFADVMEYTPDHVHSISTAVDLIYYSTFVLLTGGCEGITPESSVAKLLVLSESLIGWFLIVLTLSYAIDRKNSQ